VELRNSHGTWSSGFEISEEELTRFCKAWLQETVEDISSTTACDFCGSAGDIDGTNGLIVDVCHRCGSRCCEMCRAVTEDENLCPLCAAQDKNIEPWPEED
jgi:hypothetical protein